MKRLNKLKKLIFIGMLVGLAGSCMIKPGTVLYPTPQDSFAKIDQVPTKGIEFHKLAINQNIKDAKLHYREYPGAGENVVLIHGIFSSTYTWEDMVPELQKQFRLSEKHIPHIWAIDMKGYGWSDKPFGADYDAFTLAREVSAWMVKMDIDSATVVGNSLGGGVALIMALDYPHRVERLVLIDAGGYVPVKKPPSIFGFLTRLPTFVIKIFFTPRFVKGFMKQVFYDDTKVTAGRLYEYYIRLITLGAVDAQKSFLKLSNDKKMRERFRKLSARFKHITQETLVVWGDHDELIPKSDGHRFNCEIDNSTMVMINNSGHVPQEEQPEDVAIAIAAFLKRAPQPKGVVTRTKSCQCSTSPEQC